MPMKSEELSRYICGINKNYEILTIAVFVKGNTMRLMGPNGSHLVHSSNSNDIIGCMREAELVWKLTDVFAIARDRLHSEEVIERIEQLKQKAAEMKKAAEEQAAKIREKAHLDPVTSKRRRKPV